MKLGSLNFSPAREHPELMAPLTAQAATDSAHSDSIWVAPIDVSLADTAAFCGHYDIGLDQSANCVIIETKRGNNLCYAACIILATDRVDVNSTVRKYFDARKASFASMETAVTLTSMEYGGITPLGLPNDWTILIDVSVIDQKMLIIGSGIRASKLAVTPEVLSSLPNAIVMDIKKPA